MRGRITMSSKACNATFNRNTILVCFATVTDFCFNTQNVKVKIMNLYLAGRTNELYLLFQRNCLKFYLWDKNKRQQNVLALYKIAGYLVSLFLYSSNINTLTILYLHVQCSTTST